MKNKINEIGKIREILDIYGWDKIYILNNDFNLASNKVKSLIGIRYMHENILYVIDIHSETGILINAFCDDKINSENRGLSLFEINDIIKLFIEQYNEGLFLPRDAQEVFNNPYHQLENIKDIVSMQFIKTIDAAAGDNKIDNNELEPYIEHILDKSDLYELFFNLDEHEPPDIEHFEKQENLDIYEKNILDCLFLLLIYYTKCRGMFKDINKNNFKHYIYQIVDITYTTFS